MLSEEEVHVVVDVVVRWNIHFVRIDAEVAVHGEDDVQRVRYVQQQDGQEMDDEKEDIHNGEAVDHDLRHVLRVLHVPRNDGEGVGGVDDGVVVAVHVHVHVHRIDDAAVDDDRRTVVGKDRMRDLNVVLLLCVF